MQSIYVLWSGEARIQYLMFSVTKVRGLVWSVTIPHNVRSTKTINNNTPRIFTLVIIIPGYTKSTTQFSDKRDRKYRIKSFLCPSGKISISQFLKETFITKR